MKNNLLLRVADEDDVDDIADLLNTCYRGEGGWTNEVNIISGQRISRDDVAAMIAGKKHYFFAFDNFGQLAEAGSRLGCIVVKLDLQEQQSQDAEHSAYVEMVAVHPAIQKQGIGGEMLGAVENFAMEHLKQGWMRLSVVNKLPELVAYYQRRGYELTGTSRPFPAEGHWGMPLEEGLKLLDLHKRLSEK